MWPRRRSAVAAPALQDAATFPTGPIVPYVPPEKPLSVVERAGLLPGDYHVDNRIVGQLLGRPMKPKEWDSALVADRLCRAFRTLGRLPMTVRPKQYGVAWPEYRHDQADGFGQTLTGAIMQRNRVIPGTSAEDVALMHEALAWPMEHLADQQDVARAVNEWAMWAAWDTEAMDGLVYAGLKTIAMKLNGKGVVVR
jgi:hypothetical protein